MKGLNKVRAIRILIGPLRSAQRRIDQRDIRAGRDLAPKQRHRATWRIVGMLRRQARHEGLIRLSAQDSRALTQSMINPPAPSEQLRAASTRYRADVEERGV
jgi:hypothetical protein